MARARNLFSLPRIYGYRPERFYRICAKSKYCCWYCGQSFLSESQTEEGSEFWLDEADIHIDHFIARARGGPDSERNLVPSCARCNLQKGARTTEQFRALCLAFLGRNLPPGVAPDPYVFAFEDEGWT